MAVLVVGHDRDQVYDDGDSWEVVDGGNLYVTKGGMRIAEWQWSAWAEARQVELVREA